MNESEETLKQTDLVLQAIAELSNKFVAFEKSVNAKFESIREGIVANNAKFDRLAAEEHEGRADIFKLRATVTELSEEVRHLKMPV